MKKIIEFLKSIVWQKQVQNQEKSPLVKEEKVKRKSVKVQKISKSPNTGVKAKKVK
jgi:hypothetical protein